MAYLHRAYQPRGYSNASIRGSGGVRHARGVFAKSKRGLHPEQLVWGLGLRFRTRGLIGPCEDSLLVGWAAAMDAFARAARLFEWNTAHGGFRLFFDGRLAVGAAAPPCERKAS